MNMNDITNKNEVTYFITFDAIFVFVKTGLQNYILKTRRRSLTTGIHVVKTEDDWKGLRTGNLNRHKTFRRRNG